MLLHPQPRGRLVRLQEDLQEAGLDALLVTRSESVRYLTGFTGSLARLLVSRASAWLIVDARYGEQAAIETDCELVRVLGSGYEEATAEAIRRAGARRVGFESGELSYWTHGRLEVLLEGRSRLVPAGGEVDALRVIKDSGEIRALRRAAAVTAEAMREVLELIQPGMTEREVAAAFELRLRQKGGEELSFPTLVGSGERSALAHALPTDRVIREGEWVLIDGATTIAGYHADMSRTIVVGRPDSRQRAVLTGVREALEAAIAAVRPGVPLSRVLKAAQDALDRHGLGSANPHGLGHGVGLALHEEPWLLPGEAGVLMEGMVLAIEPGAYFPAWGGCRLEELVLVGEAGPERLTTLEGRPVALFPAAESC